MCPWASYLPAGPQPPHMQIGEEWGGGIGGDTLYGPSYKGLSELIYFLDKSIRGPDPFPLMSHEACGQQDQEAHFTSGDPGKESSRHTAGIGDLHRFTQPIN